MQEFWLGYGKEARFVQLPAADEELFPGVRWGRGDTVDTPAYWALRCKMGDNPLHGFCDSSGDLLDEIGFCMLGGFGITVELNLAAYDHLAQFGVFDLANSFTENEIRALLSEPLLVNGKWRKYRFPNQRARRVALMREQLSGIDINSLSPGETAKVLKELDGIGPKTAAWILRNHFGSDEVAILDIHVIRACTKLGVFPTVVKLPRDYDSLQSRFLELAQKLGIRPSVLDAVMWSDMRTTKQH